MGPEPADGLQAKFSIPYLTAYTLMHGPPTVESFDAVDPEVVERARTIEIRSERDQLPSEFALYDGQSEIARVEAALGSPQRPMDAHALAEKVRGLTGEQPGGLDPDEPARQLLSRFFSTSGRPGRA